jgi:transcriptional regulator with XRE-family HTH domain
MEILEPEPPHDEEHVASLKGMGHAITIIRERRRMTREELAPKAEMTVEELEAIERGELHERWGGLRAMAQALGMTLPELLNQAEEQAPGPGGEQWRRRSGEAEADSAAPGARSRAAERRKQR